MVGTYELVVEVLGVLLALSAVVLCLREGLFSRYVALNLYLLATVAFTVGNFCVRSLYGYTSSQYFYFYYTGDAIVTVINYLLIGSFFNYLFRHSAFRKYVQLTISFFFVGVVIVSGLFISGNVERFYSTWVYEFEQNMYFVGVLLTFLLWMAMTYLGAETRRFALLVSGMGVFFAAHAANYAVRSLFPSLSALTLVVPPLAYNFMVGLWLYTFLRVPEEELAVQPARQVFQRLAPVGAHSLKK